MIKELGLETSVEFVGEINAEEKDAFYDSADLFVLPSHTENFGVAVAEAMAHGLPVIATKGTPWSDLNDYGCGWWIDNGIEPLADALRQAMSLGDDQRHSMGALGKQYVQRYEWATIAQQMTQVYRWVAGESLKPEFIYLD